MANSRGEGVGLGLRLSRDEYRHLERLAQATGRKPAGVVRLLITGTSLADSEALAKLRSTFCSVGGSDDVSD